jgi:hypothetical protein
MESWGRLDAHFDSKALYENIVMALESDPEDPWVVETLKWWNEYV